MKKYLYTILILSMAHSALAQDGGITYQAVIYRPGGEALPGQDNLSSPLADTDICIRFGIIDLADNLEYQEEVKAKTDGFGMVNLVIGTGNRSDGYVGDFDEVLWDGTAKFLRVGLDTTGSCSRFEEIGYGQFNYVPFAFAAKNAANVTGTVSVANGGTGAATVDQARRNLGLEQVSNTADRDKPLSSAAEEALGGKEDLTNKSTDILGDAGSDVKYPSVRSVKDYVDNATLTGPQGPAGLDGADGVDGADGLDGADGADGLDGATGPMGPQGPAGLDGADGVDGLDGATGPMGPQGSAGLDGADGVDGLDGADGADGLDGATGPMGPQGPAGLDGLDGATGPMGPAGLDGANGADGLDGATGPQGLAGLDGADGATGPQGPAGNDGATGLTGPQGPVGPTGPAGADGVGIAQTLSFTSPNLALSDGGGSIDLTDIINATHTGDVTGATALTITTNAVTTDKILDNNVTDAKIVAVSASKLTGTVGIANGGTNITTYTQGDILYATSATELTKLPAGTAGQVLTMNSGATAPEWVAATTATYAIGETHQGGIIFYLDASGKHGLIAAPSDQSTGIQWYNGSFLDTYAYGNGIGAGEGNSQGIRRWQGTCSSCYASELCQDLNLGGQTDWYLPSKYELNLMYENIGQGNALGLGNIGGFASAGYWSSTEYDSTSAWLQYFLSGGQYSGKKETTTNRVRAVRAF